MCVIIYVRVCMCLSMQAYVSQCACESERTTSRAGPCLLSCLRQSLSLLFNIHICIPLGSWSERFWEFFCLYHLPLEYWHWRHTLLCLAFYGHWASELRSSTLGSKHSPTSHLPRPDLLFWFSLPASPCPCLWNVYSRWVDESANLDTVNWIHTPL